MAHTPHTTLHELLADIRHEDTTELLSIIEHVNTAKLNHNEAKKLLFEKSATSINKLSDNQVELLKVMLFKGGHALSFYRYGATDTALTIRASNIMGTLRTYLSDYTLIPVEDTKFLSTYMKTKWKNAQPFTGSVKKVRGADASIAMDMFSLSVFKQSIKKPFLRTEAKVLVQKVNKAFTSNTPETIKIRNKFYAIILDNTPEHTKALYNELLSTRLDTNGGYYQPEDDEAICVNVGALMYDDLISVATRAILDGYVTDTNIVTHLKPLKDDIRFNNRVLGAASAMISLYHLTKNDTYFKLGKRMLAAVDTTVAAEQLLATESAITTHKILKEIHEQTTQTIKD